MRRHRGGANFTHFASIPFISHKLRQDLSVIQQQVYTALKTKNLQKSLKHNNPNLFHLTLSMLTLPHTNQKQKVQQLLQKQTNKIQQLINGYELTVSDIGYFTRRNHQNKNQSHINVIYLDVQDDDSYKQVQKVVDFVLRMFLKEDVISDTQLKGMNIQYDHNSNMFRNKKLHITMFRCEGLTENKQFLEVYEQIKQQFRGKKLALESVDISTRFKYDESKFYEPLYRVSAKQCETNK